MTVVPEGIVSCSLFDGTVTEAPTIRDTFEPGGNRICALDKLKSQPIKVTAGRASVPDVPEKVAQVVPAGTLAELIAPPTAMPAPLDTDAASEPLVVVNAMLVIDA